MRKPAKKRDGLTLRGTIWCFRRTVDGKRVTVSTGCTDRRQAERRKTEIEKDQNDGIFGWKKPPVVVVPVVEAYVALTYDTYYKHQEQGLDALAKFTRFVLAFPDRRLDGFTLTDCEGYLNGLDLADNTIRGHHIMLKSLWNRAVADGLLAVNPWESFPLRDNVPRERVMSYAEQVQLFPLLSPSVRRAATVALWTGLRNGELCQIVRDDVDYVLGVIRVRAAITKGKRGKKKGRIVPLSPEAAAAIREQIAALDGAEPRLGPSFWGRSLDDPRIFPYRNTTLVAAFGSVVKTLGLPSLTIHDLRRTFATRSADAGVSMRRLQKWLGHSKIEMTARFYTHVDEYDLADLVRLRGDSQAKLDAATPAKVLPIDAQKVGQK